MSVELRHPRTDNSINGGDEEPPSPVNRRSRPRSASYVALRTAVYQLTSMGDFKREKIGSGFFADVFKVKHKVTGEVMVLKMNKSRKTSKAMLSEIQLMNRLSHPNILKFKGSCVHEGHLHALTEYINGGSLEELLLDKSVHLSWSVRLKISEDIAKGMAYLHSRNVFHRDLNPKNCLIKRDRNGRLHTVVADFGLAAKIKQRRRRSHTEVVGSPYWMAPECLNGKNYCEQADVFSFGITLAEIISRVPADPDFMPRTKYFGVDLAALRCMCEEDCPEEFFQLIKRCCEIDPDDRPSFEDVLEALESINIPDHLKEDYHDREGEKSSNILLSSNHDLRNCISEPLLRLDDEIIPEDDSRSCGSEGESRIIVDHHFHHRQRQLSSLGSSTGSSCGSILEDDTTLNEENEETETPSNKPNEINTSAEVYDTPKGLPVRNSSLFNTEKLLERRNSDGTLQQENDEGVKCHRKHSLIDKREYFKKSNSFNIGCDYLDKQTPSYNQLTTPIAMDGTLNCSMQTLVGEEYALPDETASRSGGGGEDSGIDPGEIEVFKFPLSQDSLKSPCDQGDHTPLCTSPLFSPTNPENRNNSPILKGVPISCSHDLASEMPFNKQHLSRSLSDEATNFNGSRASVTTNEQCTSPVPSWTSSELSFCLPAPSTPWAPPSSPIPPYLPHSLPTSPLHHSCPYCSQTNRHCQEFAIPSNTTPCLRNTSKSRRPQSCRNSALFPELKKEGSENFESLTVLMQDGFKRKFSPPKTVHFMDSDYYDESRMFCSEQNAMYNRSRSQSNPMKSARKHSLNYPLIHGYSEPRQGDYNIKLRIDLSNAGPDSCKYYSIVHATNTRLSSSEPDLTRLILPSQCR